MKLSLMRTATGKEDPELSLLQRISSLELPASEIAAQINASQSSSNRHNCSEETVWIRPSLSNCCKETTSKGHQWEEETCLGQETQAMNIRPVEICPLVWWVQIWDFWFQPPCLCETQSRWTNDRLMCEHYVKHGGGVMVLCWWHCRWFFRIQGTLNQHGYHSILQQYAIPSGLRLVGLSFVFQQDNDPTHPQAM